MKKYLVIFMVIVFASVAYAGQFYTAPNSTSETSLPKKAGWPTINAISFTATNATGDVTVHGGDNTTVTFSPGKAATATTFIVSTCVGLDDGDIVVLQEKPRPLYADAPVLESASMSSCVETTLLMTLGAGTTNAFSTTLGGTVYEMKTITTLADVGTSTVTYIPGPLWGGAKGKPMAARITAGTIHWMSGGWQ